MPDYPPFTLADEPPLTAALAAFLAGDDLGGLDDPRFDHLFDVDDDEGPWSV